MSVDPHVTEPTITYRVADLLDQIRKEQTAGFSRLERSLELKADKADLEAFEGRLNALRNDVRELEKERDERQTAAKTHAQLVGRAEEFRRWVIPVLLTVALVVVTALTLLH